MIEFRYLNTFTSVLFFFQFLVNSFEKSQFQFQDLIEDRTHSLKPFNSNSIFLLGSDIPDSGYFDNQVCLLCGGLAVPLRQQIKIKQHFSPVFSSLSKIRLPNLTTSTLEKLILLPHSNCAKHWLLLFCKTSKQTRLQDQTEFLRSFWRFWVKNYVIRSMPTLGKSDKHAVSPKIGSVR